MGRSILRLWPVLAIPVVVAAGGIAAGGTAQAAAVHGPGPAIMSAGRVMTGTGQAAQQSMPLTAPCEYKVTAHCQSVDPEVKLFWDNQTDSSECTATWRITWGDDSEAESVTTQGSATEGFYLLAKHSYPTAEQQSYSIVITAVSVTGGSQCRIYGGNVHFTLLAFAALGDSFSSGTGAGDYLPGTGRSGNYCLRSANAYSVLVAKSLGNTDPAKQDSATFDFVACN